MAADLSAYPDRESELTHALAAMRSRLAAAAEAAGRNVGEIELLPITKFFPATDVAILFRLGCRSVGESREQEASAKMAELNRLLAAAELGHSGGVHWHMVGRIQRNKAGSLARWAHTAHSVDSSRLVTALDRAVVAALAEHRRGERLRVYVQVSLDGDGIPGRRRQHDARRRRPDLRAGAGVRGPRTGRVDGHSAAGLGPGRGL